MASRMEQLLTALADGKTVDFNPMTRNEAIIKRIMENGPGGGGGGATPDWNAAEGEPGHVLNRTHWVEKFEGEVFPETALEVEEGQVLIFDPINNFVVGGTYTVTLNGVDYVCVASEYDMDTYTAVTIGNTALTGVSGYDDVPFAMVVVPPDRVETEGIGAMFMMLEEYDEYVVKIYGNAEIVHIIDDKFLPKQSKVFNISLYDYGLTENIELDGESKTISLETHIAKELAQKMYREHIRVFANINYQINDGHITTGGDSLGMPLTVFGNDSALFGFCYFPDGKRFEMSLSENSILTVAFKSA